MRQATPFSISSAVMSRSRIWNRLFHSVVYAYFLSALARELEGEPRCSQPGTSRRDERVRRTPKYFLSDEANTDERTACAKAPSWEHTGCVLRRTKAPGVRHLVRHPSLTPSSSSLRPTLPNTLPPVSPSTLSHGNRLEEQAHFTLEQQQLCFSMTLGSMAGGS